LLSAISDDRLQIHLSACS